MPTISVACAATRPVLTAQSRPNSSNAERSEQDSRYRATSLRYTCNELTRAELSRTSHGPTGAIAASAAERSATGGRSPGDSHSPNGKRTFQSSDTVPPAARINMRAAHRHGSENVYASRIHHDGVDPMANLTPHSADETAHLPGASALSRRVVAAGRSIALAGVVIPLVMIGILKFTQYEIDALKPLIGTTPWLAWLYAVLGYAGTSYLLGIVELITAALFHCLPLVGSGRASSRRAGHARLCHHHLNIARVPDLGAVAGRISIPELYWHLPYQGRGAAGC